jgi:hypothetical protein
MHTQARALTHAHTDETTHHAHKRAHACMCDHAGAYYESGWNAAANAHADIVGVTSFNEWHEGTQARFIQQEHMASHGCQASLGPLGRAQPVVGLDGGLGTPQSRWVSGSIAGVYITTSHRAAVLPMPVPDAANLT